MAFDQCADVRAEAASFVLGDVPAEARAAMVTHLDSCGGCRREVATLAEVLDSISMATRPMAPAPGFVERVLTAAEPLIATPDPYVEQAAARAVAQRPVAVVMRRRRTLLTLTAATAGLSLMAVGLQAWPVMALAVLCALLEIAYLGLVIRITHTRARFEMVEALRAGEVADDFYWRQLESEVVFVRTGEEQSPAPVVAVPNTALAHFVAAYFAGWVLTPVVALIALIRGDLTGLEQSPLLARIVELQRRGRAQSLKLLVAGATTVAVAGGGTATMLVAPGMASAATAGPTYTVHAGDTLSAIAARYGMTTSYLAQINGITDPNLILPGEVIRLTRTGPGAAAPTSGGGATYVVRMGDTLDAIAARFGTSEAELASLNHLADPNLILVGQIIRLPHGAVAASAGPSTGAGPTAGRYTVRPGDTLGSIAARFGTTVASLAAANHIADPNLIEVGQVITLAPGAAPVTSTPITAAPAPAPAPARTTSAPVSGSYVNPFRFGSWSASRTDEGVDWIPNTVSPVVAIGDGVITYSSMDSGWPGGGFITYRLTSGSHAGYYVYVAEHITNLLPAGTTVRAGQQIATALPGYPWTEWGWASPSGPEPAPSARYGGAADGTATAGGKAFARFLISLGVTGVTDPGPGPTTP